MEATNGPRPSRNTAGVYKILDGLYISGIEGAKEVSTLRQQGVTHILNMVGPGVYDHPLAGGREQSYFPHLFKCNPSPAPRREFTVVVCGAVACACRARPHGPQWCSIPAFSRAP